MGRSSGDLRRRGTLTHRSPVLVLPSIPHSRDFPVGQDTAEALSIEVDG